MIIITNCQTEVDDLFQSLSGEYTQCEIDCYDNKKVLKYLYYNWFNSQLVKC